MSFAKFEATGNALNSTKIRINMNVLTVTPMPKYNNHCIFNSKRKEMQDKPEEECFLQRLHSPTAGSNLPPSELSSSDPFYRTTFDTILPSLISGPDLEVWPVCWISAKFLVSPISRKGWVAPPQIGLTQSELE